MSLKTSPRIGSGILLVVLLLAMTSLVQCGKKPGHDKTAYLLTKKLNLSDEQAKELARTLDEIKALREQDCKKYEGDSKSLLKAARARRSLEYERIESILDESQKARYRGIKAEKEVSDRTLVLSDRLGLDRTTTNRVDRIVVRMPTEEERIAGMKSGDPLRIQALEAKAAGLREEIESFLNDEQKVLFKKMVQEEDARILEAKK